MSSTRVLAVYPGERVEQIEELRNSWGSAPYVWDSICKRYLGASWFERGRDKVWMDGLWSAWKRTDIPLAERAVLMLTFDRAYCVREDLPRMAQAIREFLTVHPPEADHVNHWPRIAQIADESYERGIVPAIGLHCTTVSPCPFSGDWDEEKDEAKPFDWGSAVDVWRCLDVNDMVRP